MNSYQADVNEELVNEVRQYAIDAHKGTPRRFTGEPYIVHPLSE